MSETKEELAQQLRDLDLLIDYVAHRGKMKRWSAVKQSMEIAPRYGVEPGKFGKAILENLREERKAVLIRHKALVRIEMDEWEEGWRRPE